MLSSRPLEWFFMGDSSAFFLPLEYPKEHSGITEKNSAVFFCKRDPGGQDPAHPMKECEAVVGA